MSSTHSKLHKEYDDSPPRNGVIFFYAVLTVFVLISVKFLLDSYFVKTMETEVHDKVLTVGLDEVAQMRAKEQEALGRNMAAARAALASRGRSGFPEIAPAPAQGAQPEVQGWTQLGRKVEVPVAPTVANETTVTPGVQPTEPAAPGPGQKPNEKTTPSSNVNPQGRSK